MSHRSILSKKAARVRKEIQRAPLPVNMDLVQWLVDRRHASTKGEARKMLEEGRVRSESHVLGRVQATVLDAKGEGEERWVAQPFVSSKFRDTLQVLSND